MNKVTRGLTGGVVLNSDAVEQGQSGHQEVHGTISRKLKEKSTNAVVKNTSAKGLTLQTPATQSIRAQFPKTPPKKKPKSAIPLKQSPSPSKFRAKINFGRSEPTLEDQDFPNTLSLSKPKPSRKRLSSISGIKANSIAEGVEPLHEPPRYSAIISSTSPTTSFMDKAKEVVTDTTRAAVRFLPSLVQSKARRNKENKVEVSAQGGLESAIESSLKTLKRSTNISSRHYEEVIDPTESEDLRKGNTTRTREYSPVYTMPEAGESCRNLLDDPTSESNGDEDTTPRKSQETYEASDEEMTNQQTGGLKSLGSHRTRKNSRKLYKHRPMHYSIHNDDSEQGFDADIEMLTEDDDDGFVESPGDFVDAPADPFVWMEPTQKKFDDDATLNLERDVQGTYDLDVEMGNPNSAECTPPHVKKYQEMLELELATRKRNLENSPIRSSAKRHLGARNSKTISPRSATATGRNRKLSLLGGPPEDVTKLSEDELCSPKYMIAPFAARNSYNKTPSKTSHSKRKLTSMGPVKSASDLMEID